MKTFRCNYCGYKSKKESMPKSCNYCGKSGGIVEIEDAEKLIEGL